ncbi:uncharacterized protein ASCRUDRAFT_10447 [Ascoidea rubescens DSM 1968]|uniref:Uncharacterized protein n=1 Tax=Ascoidea rubescens DSM 1968 TaxID=1344418 RepID=A0A1D2V920_9ASCO|nr:hypothetical protein ASCRUDRAFT_10447 [Ascoidea rubescens DSM 1968]ODV58186.1 hypothetical protein ASCRUDRAFT_10447 [Ascoidea rubescens DSM 1968]
MSDILSSIENTLAGNNQASGKKGKKGGKKGGKKLGKTSGNSDIRLFDDLETFQLYLQSEEDDQIHAQVSYIPQFVLNSCHNDPEKIKPSMNKKNKKFVRHLNQHIKKNLLTTLPESTGFSDMQLKLDDTIDTPDKLTYKYTDHGDHSNKLKVEVEVGCFSDNANVFIDYKTYPC